ncbi:MAG TPA: hypothetical protein VLC55_11440, partial [Burkholderiales bacterium]|nr:hypothetical protein [Burkholderiales bacterium]
MTDPRLHAVYQRISSKIGDSSKIEPLESVETVFRHRRFWQPEKLRVVLLAESHVYTAAEELLNRVDLTLFGVHGAPPEYARFVYCLGYGEDKLVQGKVVKNAGTWQFWRLFYSCVNPVDAQTDFSPVLKGGERDFRQRVANKLAVLREMKRRGIWLVDASVIALYTTVGQVKDSAPATKGVANKARRAAMEIAIQECWQGLWEPELGALRPRHILCIGRDVERFLGDALPRQ